MRAERAVVFSSPCVTLFARSAGILSLKLVLIQPRTSCLKLKFDESGHFNELVMKKERAGIGSRHESDAQSDSTLEARAFN